MKAVILAAGKGTRMRELTQEVPKPMLTVQGRPVLEHILQGLINADIRHICIITGHKAEVIESYFGAGERWNARIQYARQIVTDGTGKAPELAKDFVASDAFLLTYGDILVRPEVYQQAVQRFNERKPAGLVTVTRGEDVTKGGVNFFDSNFWLRKIIEKPSASQIDQLRNDGWLQPGQPVWYNAGIYIFEPVLFEFTAKLQKSPRGEYELPDAINAMLAAGHRFVGFEIAGRWVDVRDPEVLASLERESI